MPEDPSQLSDDELREHLSSLKEELDLAWQTAMSRGLVPSEVDEHVRQASAAWAKLTREYLERRTNS